MLAMENLAVNASVSTILSQPRKWRTLLDQFEDVLAFNIFMVDPEGRVIVPLSDRSQRGDFGASFLRNTFVLEPLGEGVVVLANFKQEARHLQVVDPFDLHLFAVPVIFENNKVNFYLLAGPIVLNKSWPKEKYLALAEQLELEKDVFLKDIYSVPVLSASAVEAIIDLLAEVVKSVLELELEKQKLHLVQFGKEIVRPGIIDAAQDIFVTIQKDELLIAILDNAIRMAQAESGSIMTLDEENQEFVIRVSRGLENKKNIMQARMKVGEGITGLAAKNKKPLFIKGTQGDIQLRPFLKRPEIKHAIVIPIVAEEKVIGVLNLCTKSEESSAAIEHIAQDVGQLSRFIATALDSL